MDITLGAQVSKDLMQEVEDARETGESRSATVRRLIREGLEDDNTNDRTELLTGTVATGVAWTALYLTSGPVGPAIIGGAFIVTVLLWSIWPDLEARI